MMSHSSHTSHSYQVVNIGYTSFQYWFYGGDFFHSKKNIDDEITHCRIFPSFGKCDQSP